MSQDNGTPFDAREAQRIAARREALEALRRKNNPSRDEMPHMWSLNGRIGRLRYLWYSFTSIALLVGAVVAVSFYSLSVKARGAQEPHWPVVVVGLLVLIVMLMHFVWVRRRFNDLDRSGWYVLVLFIPVVGFIANLFLLFAPGTPGSNSYGEEPPPHQLFPGMFVLVLPVLMLLACIPVKHMWDRSQRNALEAQQRAEQAQAEAQAKADEEVEAGRERNAALLDTLRRRAVSHFTDMLKGVSRHDELFVTARRFELYYLTNGRARSDFCHEQGVDIPAWNSAFNFVNHTEHRSSVKILALQNVDGDAYEQTTYVSSGSKMRALIQAEMQLLGETYGRTPVEMCQQFNDQAETFARVMSVERAVPEVEKILIGH